MTGVAPRPYQRKSFHRLSYELGSFIPVFTIVLQVVDRSLLPTRAQLCGIYLYTPTRKSTFSVMGVTEEPFNSS